MKDDGDADSLNVINDKIEIEFPIGDIQEKGSKSVFKILNYKKTNSYKKERKSYSLFNCDLSVDIMNDKVYFEIEFKNKEDMERIIILVKDYLVLE
jgi:adenylate cyclase class IV